MRSVTDALERIEAALRGLGLTVVEIGADAPLGGDAVTVEPGNHDQARYNAADDYAHALEVVFTLRGSASTTTTLATTKRVLDMDMGVGYSWRPQLSELDYGPDSEDTFNEGGEVISTVTRYIYWLDDGG